MANAVRGFAVIDDAGTVLLARPCFMFDNKGHSDGQ